MDNARIIHRFDHNNDWLLQQGNGNVINLSVKSELDINECDWLDDDHRFIVAMYHEWDSSEYFAILDNIGSIVKKGIREIQEYIKEHDLFVVQLSGFGIGDVEARYYSIEPEDWRMAVVYGDGKYLIEPAYDTIVFEPDERLFIVNQKYRFRLDSKAFES